MVRGTTPTFKLILNDDTVDLTTATKVYVTFSQNGIKLTKSEDLEILEKEVDVFLSQEETLAFVLSSVEIQINWIYGDGKRACTNIVRVPVGRNLISEVLE